MYCVLYCATLYHAGCCIGRLCDSLLASVDGCAAEQRLPRCECTCPRRSDWTRARHSGIFRGLALHQTSGEACTSLGDELPRHRPWKPVSWGWGWVWGWPWGWPWEWNGIECMASAGPLRVTAVTTQRGQPFDEVDSCAGAHRTAAALACVPGDARDLCAYGQVCTWITMCTVHVISSRASLPLLAEGAAVSPVHRTLILPCTILLGMCSTVVQSRVLGTSTRRT
ncbi:hypothetical protein T440DRAFT_203906 [Plenodomus tracheiphilus IPT5]|uniref:Uncharacterized protein n=1 Tax=Plenodomus tracheiphilus IPT5 TaxID=1408161 RepID=A0A6A7BKY4_9PLEO|nr:hypothetical protein T440DRAFT_203906 [Plenodomus tracheiphilus IPT5]